MAPQVVEILRSCLDRPNTVLVDGTVGLGGHAFTLLDACPLSSLIGIDRDGEALAAAAERLAPFGDRVHLVRARFDELGAILDELGIDHADAILLDLGLSSLQIDEARRGFAYAQDGPLDMRMDDRQSLNAATIVNTWDLDTLVSVLRDYGEEPHAHRIARVIVSTRESTPITSTGQLVEIVTAAMPAAVRYGSGGHPAKRVFQALRMAVNDEASSLAAALPVALSRLAPGGRLAVLSYHSLDDRLVKRTFQQACQDQAPRGLPVVPESMRARFKLVSKGALRPDDAEVGENPRAASARLRVIEGGIQ